MAFSQGVLIFDVVTRSNFFVLSRTKELLNCWLGNCPFYPTAGIYRAETFTSINFFLNLCFYCCILCYQTRCYCVARALTDSHVTSHFQLLQNNWNHLSFFLGHWVKYDSWASEMLKLKKHIGTQRLRLKSPPSPPSFVFTLSQTEEIASI